jgi:hypothetical protein
MFFSSITWKTLEMLVFFCYLIGYGAISQRSIDYDSEGYYGSPAGTSSVVEGERN